MKFRKTGVKRQHSIIADLRKVLERVAQWEEVQGIIPGRIERTRGGGPLKLTVSYETTSGLKAIARRSGSVQEVFLISSAPAALLARLEAEGLIGD